MSFTALKAAWRIEAPLRLPEKMLLLALAYLDDRPRGSWRSIRSLATTTRTSDRTVVRAVARLVELKLIRVETRHDRKGRQTSNRYHVLIGREGEQQVDESVAAIGEGVSVAPLDNLDKRGRGGCQPGVGEGVTVASRRVSACHPLFVESSGKESIRKESKKDARVNADALTVSRPWTGCLPVSMREEFGRFWARYPKRVHRARAEEAWFYERRKVTAEVIMAGLEQAIASDDWARITDEGRSCVPDPGRWLNGGGYASEYTAVREMAEG